MATTQTSHDIPHDLVEDLVEFLNQYYREDVAQLAQQFPRDSRSLALDVADLARFDGAVADDLLTQPERLRGALEDALTRVDIPLDVDFSRAHVRPHNLGGPYTYFPGEFSPSEHAGHLRAIHGEVAKATDAYAMHEETAFECQRCHAVTRVPQTDTEFREPHECQSCERQGPFSIQQDQSSVVDGQKLRIQTPPDEAQGDGTDIDVLVEDDLAGAVTVGDRVTVTGVVHLEQQEQGRHPTNKFDPYIEGLHIEREETDVEDLDITAEQRERIEQLASGTAGDPLDLAAQSLAPKIYGYETVKRALILSLVGGEHVEYGGQDSDRGQFHALLIGDPSTAKSKLIQRAREVGWRSVGVSGKRASEAGITATAVQDDFGDGSWTLDSGAAVEANKGVLAIDELDDMDDDARDALLEPMANQEINVAKAGINTTLQTRVAVIAAANPRYGRFDPYEPIAEQFDFGKALLSRFDLVFTFRDEPEPEADRKVADHVLGARDAAKRDSRDLAVDGADQPDRPVAPADLRAWIALAKQQPAPVFADDEVRDHIRESFLELRSLYGDPDPDDPVPVTFRNLEAVLRIAEAAARFEFSDTIDRRHASIATDLVGESMQDVGKDPETGELDADIIETGASKSQKERIKSLQQLLGELQREYDDGIPWETALDRAEEVGIERSTAESDLQKLKDKGIVYEPSANNIRYVGGY